MKHANQPLIAEVKDGQLIIRVGVNCLACATAFGNEFQNYSDQNGEYYRDFAITDVTEFAKEVANAILHEEEDGSGPLGDFLDRMSQAAIDDGALGIEYGHYIKYGETHPDEKWHQDKETP